MKKNVLLSGALLIAISSYSQINKQQLKTSVVNRNMNSFNALLQDGVESSSNSKSLEQPINEPLFAANAKSSSIAAPFTVSKIGSSINVFGVYYSFQKPLQWNDNINGLSFIYRQSPTYSAVGTNATGKSGTILALLSNNMGTTWDSTCMWVNNLNLARYPQGALYSSPGNTNYNNAYAVASGPATGATPGSGWIGSWYASKSVTALPKNAPGTDQQFFPNTATVVAGVAKHDNPFQSFTSTDDGYVRSLASLYSAYDSGNNPINYRGALVMKGSFNAGAFTWSSDSLVPSTLTTVAGEKHLSSRSLMAWNDAGTIGYVIMLGVPVGQTLSNKGYQPIVYKTTTSGASWVLMNGIDFNNPNMQFVKDRLVGVSTNSNLIVPQFNSEEGMDATVDNFGNLHLATTIISTGSSNNDSLGFYQVFTSKGTYFPFVTGGWPYVYDFTLNGTNQWKAYTIDSLQTQAAGILSTSGGYTANVWAPDNTGRKATSGSRIQLSRTPSGDCIGLVWAESDTLLTSNKFNQFPDLKGRLVYPAANGIAIDANVTNITSTLPSTIAVNNRVRSKAYFNLISPKMEFSSGVYNLPITISNNTALDGNTTIDHFYLRGALTPSPSSVSENKKEAINAYQLIPNPANEKVNITMNLLNNGVVDINIYNMVGQIVKSTLVNGQLGSNTIAIDIENIPSGVYMVKTMANGSSQTKKLIVE